VFNIAAMPLNDGKELEDKSGSPARSDHLTVMRASSSTIEPPITSRRIRPSRDAMTSMCQLIRNGVRG
jgi:hypothetical protein